MTCSRNLRRTLEWLLVALLCWPLTGRTQTDHPPLYQVEVVVFTTGALAGWTEEFWPWPPELKTLLTPAAEHDTNAVDNSENPGENAPQDGTGTLNPAFAPGAENDDPAKLGETPLNEPPQSASLEALLDGQPPAWAPGWMEQVRPVSPAQRLLDDAVARLSPKRGYRVLLHRAWIQPAVPDAKSRFIRVTGANAYGDSADLRVRFHLDRYAHVNLDLEVNRRIPKAAREAFAAHESVPLEQLPEFWTFHQTAHRKLKSGEWHYIDHPLFGTLVVINRVRP